MSPALPEVRATPAILDNDAQALTLRWTTNADARYWMLFTTTNLTASGAWFPLSPWSFTGSAADVTPLREQCRQSFFSVIEVHYR